MRSKTNKSALTTAEILSLMNNAVCRDCKKQWNLDRQRARKIAAKKEAEQAEAKPVDKAESKVAVRPAESSVSKKGAAEENPAAKKLQSKDLLPALTLKK